MQSHAKQSGIFAGLALLMAATRYNHFGSAVSLPDASLAVFFLAGFFLAWRTWPALLGFVVLLLEAGGMDYYATATQGVSNWCITPAYWFLVPTYASLWLGGWFAVRQDHTWRGLTTSGVVAWLATTIAFLISNISFYLLSGRVSDMSAAEYASAVAKYYPPYLGGSLPYLAVAALLYVVLTSGRCKESVDPARN